MNKKIGIVIIIVLAVGFLAYYFVVMQGVFDALNKYKDQINDDLRNTIGNESNKEDVVGSDEENWYVRVYEGECPGPQCGCQIIAHINKVTGKVIEMTYDTECNVGSAGAGVPGCDNFECSRGGVDDSGTIQMPEDMFELSDCQGLDGENLAICYMNVALYRKNLSVCFLISDQYSEIRQECEWARG